jgi:hypothetical protein
MPPSPRSHPHRTPAELRRAHDALLFESAYPADRPAWQRAQGGLRELADAARAMSGTARGGALLNSGIAGTPVSAAFSLAITEWLVARFGPQVSLATIEGDKDHVMAVLGAALDPIEQEVLGESRPGWVAWQRRYLGHEAGQRLARLLRLVRALPGSPAERESVFASMRVFVRWQTEADAPLLTAGRFARGAPWFHPGPLQRRAAPGDAWHEGRPRRMPLTAAERRALADLARGVMASLLRETDFFSYANEREIELHDLGCGVRAALFASVPARKLALEAYVGYLLLKNHVPIAYGGGWVLGRQARFGINVLPPFRGGESARVLCQLLRLYAWRFGLKLFVVEPYQIGKGNPDGIRSGSFWFYWRLGFRPLQPGLRQLAQAEADRLAARGGRTPAQTLRRLADSLMAWETPLPAHGPPLDIEAIGQRVSRDVLERFDGDRMAARRAAMRRYPGVGKRLAVLLAALEPTTGWRTRDVQRLATLAPLKDTAELSHAVALQRHAALMRALADASDPSSAAPIDTNRRSA